MGYIALVQQKVQVTKGGKTYYEIRQPGDPIPEAEKWANPALWVARGYIRADKNTVVPRGNANAPKGMRAMTKEDFAARAKRKQDIEAGVVELRPEPAFIPDGKVGPVLDEPLDEVVAAAPDEGDGEDAAPESSETKAATDKAALLELSKKDLLKMAKKLKLDVAPAFSKEKLADAILASDESKE